MTPKKSGVLAMVLSNHGFMALSVCAVMLKGVVLAHQGNSSGTLAAQIWQVLCSRPF